MDGWNTTFLLGRPIFSGYVSFREGNPMVVSTTMGGEILPLDPLASRIQWCSLPWSASTQIPTWCGPPNLDGWLDFWIFGSFFSKIHSRKLTWNLKMMVSNRKLLFQVSIFGCHVSFRGCTPQKWGLGLFQSSKLKKFSIKKKPFVN